MDADAIERRLRAVERALADADADPTAGGRDEEVASRLADAEERLDGFDERLAELDAAVQALRGYAGNVRAVNADVERRADAALATAERLESRVDDHERERSCRRGPGADRGSPDSRGRAAAGDGRGARPARGTRDGRANVGGRADDATVPRFDGTPAERAEAALAVDDAADEADAPTLLDRIGAWL